MRLRSGRRDRGSSGSGLTVITVDQVISGASNVLIALIAAHVLSASTFGLFGIAFLIYTVLVCVSRAIVSDPVLVHQVESRARRGEVIGSGWIVALPLTCGLLVTAVVIRIWSAGLGDALLVLAACLPLLVIQDVGRYLAYAGGRPWTAVMLDSAWLVAMLGGVAALALADVHTLPGFIGVWGASGALAGMLVFAQVPPREIRFGLAWLRYTWTMSWQFLVSYIALQGTTLGMSSEVAAIDGSRPVGGVQGAVLLTRPFSTFAVAVVASGVGQVARDGTDARRVRRHAVVLAAIAGGAAALNLLGMLLMPTALGHALLGHAWGPAEPLLLPTGVAIVFAGLTCGPQTALIGTKQTGTAMAINIASIPLLLISALAGALIDGVLGAVWFAAAAHGVIAIVWWAAHEARTRRSGLLSSNQLVPLPVTSIRLTPVAPAGAGGGIVLTVAPARRRSSGATR